MLHFSGPPSSGPPASPRPAHARLPHSNAHRQRASSSSRQSSRNDSFQSSASSQNSSRVQKPTPPKDILNDPQRSLWSVLMLTRFPGMQFQDISRRIRPHSTPEDCQAVARHMVALRRLNEREAKIQPPSARPSAAPEDN